MLCRVLATTVFKLWLVTRCLKNWENTWVPDEDLAFGKELLSIMKYPFDIAEAAKLSQFFRHLLINHSLNTVVASTMRNIQPLGGDNIKDFSAINMWYEGLDKRYNFSLGPVILPLLQTDNLTRLAELDPPYLKDLKASIDDPQIVNFSILHGKILKLIKIDIHVLGDKCVILGEDPSQVSHPPHLTSTWSSAFIPFCAYKTDLNISKNPFTLPGITFPLCSAFLPTILEGQLTLL